jgi:lysophospholipase L1-like esterase
MKSRSKITSVVLAGLVWWISATPARSQGPPPIFNPPKSYYLALGDSIAYGFQSFKFAANLPPEAYNTGYVDVFGTQLRQIRPGITTVSYGCPGESTGSFVAGPCVWTATGRQLHDAFTGTQLQAALTFLQAHPGQVSPITLTLGSDDLPLLLGPCTVNGQIDLACVQAGVPAFIAGLGARISGILEQLRSAAPDAEIILTGQWDSFLTALAFADPLYQTFNMTISAVAARNRVRFADPFPIFNPQGDPNAEIRAFCSLSLLCSQNDGHPSDAGYQALARLVFDASQYGRLQ